MTTLSPLEGLLATFDRHINSLSAQSTSAPSEGGLAALSLRRTELRNLIAGASSSSSNTLQLSPLERAIYYEVDNRRHRLERKAKDLDFWEAYEHELAESPMKMPTSASALERQIAEKKQKLRYLEGENRLRVETTRALESSAAIQKVLTTTAPHDGSKKREEGADQHYASTRELLNERDDQALEFLKIFNETASIRKQRIAVKARIRDQRLETMKLLENIKSVKADIRNRQLHPSGSAQQDPDASQDIVVIQKVQQMQREINEARSKKELVKGILRGLILESGRDWTKSPATRALMLSLDDEEDASDDAFSEEEEEADDADDDNEEKEEEEEAEIDQLEDA